MDWIDKLKSKISESNGADIVLTQKEAKDLLNELIMMEDEIYYLQEEIY